MSKDSAVIKTCQVLSLYFYKEYLNIYIYIYKTSIIKLIKLDLKVTQCSEGSLLASHPGN